MQLRALRSAHGAKRQRQRPFFQSQKQRTERHEDQGPRRGAACRKVSSEPADQVVVKYRTGAVSATTPLQSTTQQCWSDHQQPRRCELPQDGAGGADQTRGRARSSAKVTRRVR